MNTSQRKPPFPRLSRSARPAAIPRPTPPSKTTVLLPMSKVKPRQSSKASQLVSLGSSDIGIIVRLNPSPVQLGRLKEIATLSDATIRYFQRNFASTLLGAESLVAGSKELSLLANSSRMENELSVGRVSYFGSGSEGLVEESTRELSRARAERRIEFEGQQFYGSSDSATWTVSRPSYHPILPVPTLKSASSYAQTFGGITLPSEVARAAMWVAFFSEILHQEYLHGYALSREYPESLSRTRFALLKECSLLRGKHPDKDCVLEIPAPVDREYLELPLRVRGSILRTSKQVLPSSLRVLWASVFCSLSNEGKLEWWASLECSALKTALENPDAGQDRLVKSVRGWLSKNGGLLEGAQDEESEETSPLLKIRLKLLKSCLRY